MLHKEPLFKLYPRRYCACSPPHAGETKLRHFPEQMVPTYGSNTPTVQNYNGYITTFTRARAWERVMRACTPWSFARERMIHASGANVGGKLSNVETGSFPRRVGKYRECQLPSPSPRTGKNRFCDSQFRGGSVCPCNFNLAVFRAMNPFTSDINEVSL